MFTAGNGLRLFKFYKKYNTVFVSNQTFPEPRHISLPAKTASPTIVYFTTRGHLFFKISSFILGVEQPYFACPSESICPNWGLTLGFCSSAVKKFFKKSLLKICIFCELDLGEFQ